MSEAGTERSAALRSTVETLSARLPERERLLLCVDFDGTLAPIVDDPDAAEIGPENRAALTELHQFPGVSVAVVSGRALDEAGFRTVERDGVGVRVGDPESGATAATEFVRTPAEATELLEWLRRSGVDRLGSTATSTGKPA